MRRRPKKRFYVIITVFLLIIAVSAGMIIFKDKFKKPSVVDEDIKSTTKIQPSTAEIQSSNASTKTAQQKQSIKKTITISAAGDCTLGSDDSFGTDGTFNDEFNKQNLDFGYFLGGVKPVFDSDDLTIVNLETTFTNATQKAEKTFRFKGDPSYVNILKQGGVEAVNVANNHIYDYLDRGYTDTITTLSQANVGYFGLGNKYITTIKGVKVGLLGYLGWEETTGFKQQVSQDIASLKNECNMVIVSFHWGNESQYEPNNTQKNLAHFVIDQGADLVLGHHPHVIQGIEKYKEKYIAYSLGNFSFGGNKNPPDKDTFIFQQSLTFDEEGTLITASDKIIIPCSVSSVSYRNDYRPTILTGSEKDRVLKKLNEISVF